ncbi:Uncharacterised protein [[Eubacterium] contortum]|uniref:Uncharacterized protein n=1 Tax=Faecalicatena contorta TaxID=39482 RepID=A0A174IFJ1_9FIRM|nr:Uncharacterised protein [[Eubacterium] contortum] [Faecalicatena contorta]
MSIQNILSLLLKFVLDKGYTSEQGLSQGVEKGIRAMVLDYIEEGFDENKILIKLQKRFTLSEQKAKEYYKKFGKSE